MKLKVQGKVLSIEFAKNTYWRTLTLDLDTFIVTTFCLLDDMLTGLGQPRLWYSLIRSAPYSGHCQHRSRHPLPSTTRDALKPDSITSSAIDQREASCASLLHCSSAAGSPGVSETSNSSR